MGACKGGMGNIPTCRHNVPPIKLDLGVGKAGGHRAVRDQHHRHPAAQGLQGFQNVGFCPGIQCAGWFVQNQHGWVTGQCPGQRQSLPFPARQGGAPVPDRGL